MTKQMILGGTVIMLAATSALAQDSNSTTQTTTTATTTTQNYSDRQVRYDENHDDLYRANEFSVDFFGTDALDQHSVDHLSGHRVRHDSRLGAGIGVNYFFLRYLGVGAEAYTEDTQHNFVDNVEGNLIARLPIGHTGLAPYAFGGAGHKFDPVIATFGQAGGGLEFRFCHNVGVFADARWVWTDHDRDYGLGRAGVRVAF